MKDRRDRTALMIAVQDARPEGMYLPPGLKAPSGPEKNQLEMAELLLDKGAEVNAKDKDDRTALMLAAEDGKADVVKLLLNRGANANSQTRDGITALMLAVGKGHYDAVKALLERQADVNAKDKDGQTALMEAAWKRHSQIVKLLIDKGAEVNAKTTKGWTPLHSAAAGGHPEIIKLLLDKGAEVNAKTDNGETALLTARDNHHKELEELLKARGAKEFQEQEGPRPVARPKDPSALLLTLRVKSDEPVTAIMDAISKRAAALGASKDDVVRIDPKTFSVRLPGYKEDANKAVRIMEKRALLEFKLVDNNVAPTKGGEIPPGDEVLYKVDRNPRTGAIVRTPYVIEKQILMTGDVLTDARVQPDPMELMTIRIEFNSVGAREFERITSEHVNERLAIILDNRVYSAPVIKDRISGGSAIIMGVFTSEEAEELALVLRCGPISAPVEVVKSEWLEQPSGSR